MALTMKAFFRAIAAAFKNPAPAQSLAGLMVLVLVLYTGYSIPKPVSDLTVCLLALKADFLFARSQCKFTCK
jgi:hypothetical protein